MDNPEKLTRLGTQDEDKQNKTQYMLDITMHKQTQIHVDIFQLQS